MDELPGFTPTEDRPQPADPEEDATASEAAAKPSVAAWVVLGVLCLAALAIPFLSDAALYTDDFSGPEVMRSWYQDGGAYVYGDGVYELTVLPGWGAPTSAVSDLPRTVTGMTVEVDAQVVRGRAAFGADCISDYTESSADDASSTVTQSAAYAFVVEPAGGYLIADVEGVLDEGILTGDVESGVVFECISDGSDTTLRLQAADGERVEFIDEGGLTSFRAFALAAYARKSGTVAFDDVTVTEATLEESA